MAGAPVSRSVVRALRRGRDRRGRRARQPRAPRQGPHGQPGPPRRGHHRRRPGRRDGQGLPAPARAAVGGGADQRRAHRGVGEAVRRRPDDRATTLALEGARAICAAAEAAGTTVTLDMEDHTTTDRTLATLRTLRAGLPVDRRGAAGLPAPHRGRLPRPRRRGLAGPALQGRLQGAGVASPSRAPRRSTASYVRCLQGADGRPGLPDGGHARPAARSPSPASWRRAARAGQLRVPDALRHPPARAGAARGGRATRCASTCRTATSGTATSCADSPNAPPTSPSSCAPWRAGDDRDHRACSASASSARRCCPACSAPARPPASMLAAERHAERAAEIAERYGVRTPTPERGRRRRPTSCCWR